MKKTTLTLMAVCLLLLLAVGVQAQVSPEARAVKANLVEVEANLADLQLRFPSSPDIPLLQEKRDYLSNLLDEFSANGTAGDVMLSRSEDKTASALYQEKMDAINNVRRPSPKLPTQENEVGMSAEQSQVWNLLQSTQNQLARLKKQGADAATIQAFEARVKTLQGKLDQQ